MSSDDWLVVILCWLTFLGFKYFHSAYIPNSMTKAVQNRISKASSAIFVWLGSRAYKCHVSGTQLFGLNAAKKIIKCTRFGRRTEAAEESYLTVFPVEFTAQMQCKSMILIQVIVRNDGVITILHVCSCFYCWYPIRARRIREVRARVTCHILQIEFQQTRGTGLDLNKKRSIRTATSYNCASEFNCSPWVMTRKFWLDSQKARNCWFSSWYIVFKDAKVGYTFNYCYNCCFNATSNNAVVEPQLTSASLYNCTQILGDGIAQ